MQNSKMIWHAGSGSGKRGGEDFGGVSWSSLTVVQWHMEWCCGWRKGALFLRGCSSHWCTQACSLSGMQKQLCRFVHVRCPSSLWLPVATMIERNNRIGPAMLHVSFIVLTKFSAQLHNLCVGVRPEGQGIARKKGLHETVAKHKPAFGNALNLRPYPRIKTCQNLWKNGRYLQQNKTEHHTGKTGDTFIKQNALQFLISQFSV